MKYDIEIMSEEEAQQMIYQYLKRFGYNPIQAFPKAAFRGDGGTLLFKIFNPEKMVSYVYFVEDEGVKHPLAVRTVAIKGDKVLLYMGLVSMKDRMKHAPEPDSMKTTGRKGGMTERGKLMGRPFFVQVQELIDKLKSMWRSMDQKTRKSVWLYLNVLVKLGFKDKEVEVVKGT